MSSSYGNHSKVTYPLCPSETGKMVEEPLGVLIGSPVLCLYNLLGAVMTSGFKLCKFLSVVSGLRGLSTLRNT